MTNYYYFGDKSKKLVDEKALEIGIDLSEVKFDGQVYYFNVPWGRLLSEDHQKIQNMMDAFWTEIRKRSPERVLCGNMLLVKGGEAHREYQKWNCDLFTPTGIGMMAYRKSY